MSIDELVEMFEQAFTDCIQTVFAESFNQHDFQAAASMTFKQPIDKFRMCITLITVLYLALAAQAALSYLFTSKPSDYGPVTLEVLGNGAGPQGRLWMKALLTDGRLLRWESSGNLTGWELQDNHGMPANLFYKGSTVALLTFHAKRFVLILQPIEWSGVIRVKRHGRTVQMMDLSSEYRRHPIVLDDPVAPMSIAVFVEACGLFAICAWWFGPWTVGRKSIPWLVFFLAVIHILYWASQPVGTNNDSEAYYDAASSVLRGSPSDKPPGYGAFLAIVGSLAGQSLGRWITLLQHGMVVLGDVWLYLLLRKITTERLALFGGILAGVLMPALTVPQGILSESATTFAMVGALYFAVRSTETGKLISAIPAGIFVAWAGLLRVAPMAGLIPATSVLCLLPGVKNRLARFLAAPAVAILIFSAPLVWCGLKSGQPKLTDSIGTHFHNRVIREQKLLNEHGPATKRLLTLLAGKDPRDFYSWELLPLREMRALPWPDQELLLRQVGMEGISTDPWGFVAYTFHLAWREFFIPTDWIPTWADTIPVSPRFENASPLTVTSSSFAWRWTLEDIQSVVWPVLCWAAIGGVLLGLLSQQRYLVLAIACVLVGYLLPTASAEIFCPRYNVPILPFVTALAIFPLELIRSWIWEPVGERPLPPLKSLNEAAAAVTDPNRTDIGTDARTSDR